jgi:hypothetical protein
MSDFPLVSPIAPADSGTCQYMTRRKRAMHVNKCRLHFRTVHYLKHIIVSLHSENLTRNVKRKTDLIPDANSTYAEIIKEKKVVCKVNA